MILTWIQVGYWQNNITLFQHAIHAIDNNFFAYNNLGVALAKEGKISEAIAYFQKSLKIMPEYVIAQDNLGRALVMEQRIPEAVQLYMDILKKNPRLTAHINLGNILISQNKITEAIIHFKKALEIDPKNVVAHRPPWRSICCPVVKWACQLNIFPKLSV